MKSIDYAEKRISLLKDEMGQMQRLFQANGRLFIEFENGMNLQIHDDEINYQATSHLESEIEHLKNG